MDIELSSHDKQFQQDVRHFFDQEYPSEIKDKIRLGKRLSKDDHIISQRALQKKKWLGISWPKEHGGTGWSDIQRYIFEMELEKAGAANIIPMGIVYIGPILVAFGSVEQQCRWLPKILDSSHFWAQGYSEPESGSDLASLSLSAVEQGEHYVLNGNKIWTTLAHWADWIFCLVRTSKNERKSDGITFLCVDMRSPGITVHPLITMNGIHELNRVTFENVQVPLINRIGDEGKGWYYANVLLGNERLSYAHVGKKKNDMRKLRELAQAIPGDGGGSLLDNPIFAARMAKLDIRVDVLEISVLRALCNGHDAAAISALKIQCTECAQAITELGLAIHGASASVFPDQNIPTWSASLMDTPISSVIAADAYLFERAQSIYGGTSEIQKGIIWKHMGR
jgi:alkylation response protein AidB-like acyl-CoA dehydrogenase